MIQIDQELQREFNQTQMQLRFIPEEKRAAVLSQLKQELISHLEEINCHEERKSYLLHQVQQSLSLDDLRDIINIFNQRQLGEKPKFMALKEVIMGKVLVA